MKEALIQVPINISDVLFNRTLPTITQWNRLEGRPRTHHFDKALKAEVRDALWMLTKQWQMGEFIANDAGSPISAKAHIHQSSITRYQAAENTFQPYEKNIPLEAKAEQKSIPFTRNQELLSIDIRLHIGHYWLKLLAPALGIYKADYIRTYKFELPAESRHTDYIYSQKNDLQLYKAIVGRSMDGYAFLQHLLNGGLASDGITNGADQTALDTLGNTLLTWYKNTFLQPDQQQNNAWLPNQLEYQFECQAEDQPKTTRLTAKEYDDGNLDWYSFNSTQGAGSPNGDTGNKTDSLIPAHVAFDGMPDTRWWKFEDSKTSFADVSPATTDLSKLLLIEFGLIFANDWFLIPFTLPIGKLVNIKGLTVSNNFGEVFWIEAAEASNTSNKEWSMFKLKNDSADTDTSLLLAPTAIKVQEGAPVEEVLFIRDEVANMVWGIETTVPSAEGWGVKGGERALQTRRYHEDIVKALTGGTTPTPPLNDARVTYLPMTDVPEHWIPFIPVKTENSTRDIQLQRGSMLRIISGDTEKPAKVKPGTSILREGLDKTTPEPYYVHEEEIPRAGIRVTQCFQRTRWLNGEVMVWLGMKKKTGKGEGSSNLQFDVLEDVK